MTNTQKPLLVAPPPVVPFQSADLTILRRKQVEARTGLRRSTIYNRIGDCLFTRPVSLGGQAVGWPAGEIAALNAARIAGMSDDEVRLLVKRLEAARSAVGRLLQATEGGAA